MASFFFIVTELEAEEGVIKAKCPKDHVSVYRRVLMGLNDGNITDQTAKRYFDTTMSTNGKVCTFCFIIRIISTFEYIKIKSKLMNIRKHKLAIFQCVIL